MKSVSRDTLWGYALITPFFLTFLLLLLYPLIEGIIIAFTYTSSGETVIGLQNFIKTLNHPEFRTALYNTILFLAVAVNIKMVLALLIANLLNKEFKGHRIVRGLILLPWALPVLTNLLSFKWMLEPTWGVIEYFVVSLTGQKALLLYHYNTAMMMIIIFHVWRNAPFWTLIFLSGLQSIPKSLYEAAEIDGASSIELFRHITLPQIKYLYIVCLTLSIIWTVGEFSTIWILTGGGPAASTHVLATLAYRFAFDLGEFGMSTATILFALPAILPLTIFLVQIIERRE